MIKMDENSALNAAALNDTTFLKELDKDRNKVFYTVIKVLDDEELPISEIQGRVTGGSISVNGSSSMRRTCNITFLAEEGDNDLEDIDNLLSLNKKIKVYIGLENNISTDYDSIIWFKQGIYVICQPTISHASTGVSISLSCKDKMCLLNGEMGGNFASPVIFSTYRQYDENGDYEEIPQLIYDIIQTLVCNYGGEPISKIFINEINLKIKQSVRWLGDDTLY
jgi:hypothetical protein